MPNKKEEFQIGEFYHIYNRGNDKRIVFVDKSDYERFLLSVKEFNQVEPVYSLHLKKFQQNKESRGKNFVRGETSNVLEVSPLTKFFPLDLNPKLSPLVSIICYNLLPNHYHLLVREKVKGGISEFMKRLGGGYTGYFNRKHERSGSLFQGVFKTKHINSDGYLNYIIAYILGNSEIHGISSYKKWTWNNYNDLFNTNLELYKIVFSEFRDLEEFEKFMRDIIKNSKEIKEEKRRLVLE